jgi:hypothetical protein
MFATPLTLTSTARMPEPLPRSVRRRLGRADTLRFGEQVAAWPDIDGASQLVVDDGARALATGLSAPQLEAVPNLRGDGWLTRARSGELAEVGFDGVTRWYEASSEDLGCLGELVGARIAAVIGPTVAVFTRAAGHLAPEVAFACPSRVTGMRVVEGRLLLLGLEGGDLEGWWFDGGVARRVARFEGLEHTVITSCMVDDLDWVWPDWIGIWDEGGAYELGGVGALRADRERERFELVATTAFPELITGAMPAPSPRPYALSPTAPHVVPKLDATCVPDPYVAALVSAIQTGAARETPDPEIQTLLATLAPPDGLRDLLHALLWHAPPHLHLGEFWLEAPTEAEAFRGSATAAIRIGTIANGDDVVARISFGRHDIVEVSHEEDAERDHGGLGNFLRHCVAYARDRGEETSLDALLPF